MIHGERGLTLIEILLALFIMSVGLVGLLVVVPVAALGVQGGNRASAATYLAQQRIEQARNAVWTDAPAVDCLGASPTVNDPPVPKGTTCKGKSTATFPDEPYGTIVGAGQYSRTTRITDCDDAPAACSGIDDSDLRLVTVTVRYRPMTAAGVASADTNVTLEWLVARR